MNKSSLRDIELQDEVEKIGIYFEKIGFTPMAGRVIAYLLVAEPHYRSFQDIQDFLLASKSSISNALNWLMNDGRLDYITFSGDRKRYFKVNPVKWEQVVKSRIRGWSSSKKMLNHVLRVRGNSSETKFIAGIERLISFESYLQNGLADLVTDWENNTDSLENFNKATSG